MEKLTNDQRDLMWLMRRRYKRDFDDIASILKCKKEHIFDAQIGKEIPDYVHKAVVCWLNDFA